MLEYLHSYISLSLALISPLSTREPGVWALERAKQNVLETYLLVGILEELEDVLLMLERLLPHYFTGVLNIYKSPGTLMLHNAFLLKYHLCSVLQLFLKYGVFCFLSL